MKLGRVVIEGSRERENAKEHGARKETFSAGGTGSAKEIYKALLICPKKEKSRRLSRDFLRSQLATATTLSCDLPDDVNRLSAWSKASVGRVAGHYKEYLKRRSRGEPRLYFKTRGQALSFITKVAPTKLVDGAWLYGALEHWHDIRFRPLVSTYLEELGNGDPDQNHVLLYKALMAWENCEAVQGLPEKYYLQGALQLSLGYHADEFLPELIGYNLGYEQLPLHLLITAYELRELGIDPCYFSLHVTIDNASTGHGHKAVLAVLENLPAAAADASDFYRRVREGYMLNALGTGSVAIIRAFDLHQEVIDILKRKSPVAQVHSDYCRIGGRTVNQWLADPEQIPSFLAALLEKGWIKLDQNPEHSRFWHLLSGPQAKMQGVFSPYELAIIHDWIAGTWSGAAPRFAAKDENRSGQSPTEYASFRNIVGIAAVLRGDRADDNPEMDRLRADIEAIPLPERIKRLIDLMAPGKHHTPAGLMATRMFAEFWQGNT